MGKQFNGKPVLTEKECKRYAASSMDIAELAIDVRGFNPLARSMLHRLHGLLRKASIQLGVTLQGCDDEELPEQFLGVANLRGLDMIGGRPVDGLGAVPSRARAIDREGETCAGRAVACGSRSPRT